MLSIVVQLPAQHIGIPDSVVKSMHFLYPKAESVIWDYTEDEEYVATFMLQSVEMSARFDSEGSWLGSIVYLDQMDVPQAIHDTLQRLFPDFEMYDVMKIEAPSGETYYEAVLESVSTALLVRFDEHGTVLLEESIDLDVP